MDRYRFWWGLCQGLADHILFWPEDVGRRDARYDCFCGLLGRLGVIVLAVKNKNRMHSVFWFEITTSSVSSVLCSKNTRNVSAGVDDR